MATPVFIKSMSEFYPEKDENRKINFKFNKCIFHTGKSIARKFINNVIEDAKEEGKTIHFYDYLEVMHDFSKDARERGYNQNQILKSQEEINRVIRTYNNMNKQNFMN